MRNNQCAIDVNRNEWLLYVFALFAKRRAWCECFVNALDQVVPMLMAIDQAVFQNEWYVQPPSEIKATFHFHFFLHLIFHNEISRKSLHSAKLMNNQWINSTLIWNVNAEANDIECINSHELTPLKYKFKWTTWKWGQSPNSQLWHIHYVDCIQKTQTHTHTGLFRISGETAFKRETWPTLIQAGFGVVVAKMK